VGRRGWPGPTTSATACLVISPVCTGVRTVASLLGVILRGRPPARVRSGPGAGARVAVRRRRAWSSSVGAWALAGLGSAVPRLPRPRGEALPGHLGRPGPAGPDRRCRPPAGPRSHRTPRLAPHPRSQGAGCFCCPGGGRLPEVGDRLLGQAPGSPLSRMASATAGPSTAPSGATQLSARPPGTNRLASSATAAPRASDEGRASSAPLVASPSAYPGGPGAGRARGIRRGGVAAARGGGDRCAGPPKPGRDGS